MNQSPILTRSLHSEPVRPMLLDEAITMFLAAIRGEVADTTVDWYTRRLASLASVCGQLELVAVDVDHLRRWRAQLLAQGQRWQNHPARPVASGRLSQHTMHANLKAVKRLFHWLMGEGHISSDPTARLRLAAPPKEPPKAITDEDLARLLTAAAASGPRDLALVAFVADTACRRAGAVGARLSELDLTRHTAVVREKGQRQRTVYFSDETAHILQDWLDVRDDESDALFTRLRGGGPLSPAGAYQVFRRLAVRAQIAGTGRRCNPHSLRHAWARRALQAGSDLGTVSEVLGHSDIGVTARYYARWTDTELQERKEKYSRPLPLAT